MKASNRLKGVSLNLLVLSVPAVVHAGSSGSSGPGIVGLFGPPQARTQVTAGAAADAYAVSLKRRGSCNGDLSSPARAYGSYVVTLSERDPTSGGTCTVDILYEPDFTAITVRESAVCLSYHGAGCTFEGWFKRSR